MPSFYSHVLFIGITSLRQGPSCLLTFLKRPTVTNSDRIIKLGKIATLRWGKSLQSKCCILNLPPSSPSPIPNSLRTSRFPGQNERKNTPSRNSVLRKIVKLSISSNQHPFSSCQLQVMVKFSSFIFLLGIFLRSLGLPARERNTRQRMKFAYSFSAVAVQESGCCSIWKWSICV